MAAVVVFAGCKPDEPEASRPTFLPVVAVVGEELEVIVAGDAYTDPGATATENGATIEYTTTGAVDPNTAGVYIISYAAVNSDGFTASASRTVIVLPEPFVAGSADISGVYARAANGRLSTVTKIVDGAYTFSDAWGSATSGGNPFPIFSYLFCTNGTDVTIPPYPTAFGVDIEGFGTNDGAVMPIQTSLVGLATRVNTWNKQ